MSDYYSSHLSSDRLRRCYELASSEVRSYLQAESDYLLGLPESRGCVLELGCGYGRVLVALGRQARTLIGIDTSLASLTKARESTNALINMDASCLAFPAATFDLVACVQNGLSAFRADPRRLVEEALRMNRPPRIM